MIRCRNRSQHASDTRRFRDAEDTHHRLGLSRSARLKDQLGDAEQTVQRPLSLVHGLHPGERHMPCLADEKTLAHQELALQQLVAESARAEDAPSDQHDRRHSAHDEGAEGIFAPDHHEDQRRQRDLAQRPYRMEHPGPRMQTIGGQRVGHGSTRRRCARICASSVSRSLSACSGSSPSSLTEY